MQNCPRSGAKHRSDEFESPVRERGVVEGRGVGSGFIHGEEAGRRLARHDRQKRAKEGGREHKAGEKDGVEDEECYVWLLLLFRRSRQCGRKEGSKARTRDWHGGGKAQEQG